MPPMRLQVLKTGKTGQKLELTLVPAQGLGTSSSDYRDPLRVLMGMVALVLVIACVNIIMLLVARSSVREREFALRLALGAGRGPLFRQLLTESGILVTVGSLLGWFFAVEATRLLAVWSELEVSLSPDRPVFLFTLAISALSALLFGLAPLRTAARAEVGLVLKSSGMQTTSTRGRMLTGKVLIALQMAFCVVLLFASGLLLRTLRNYQNVDLGMRAESVLAVGVHPVGAPDYAHSLAFYTQLTERLRALPGVKSVTLAELRPGTGWSDNAPLTIDGHLYPWDNGRNMLRSNLVGPDFLRHSRDSNGRRPGHPPIRHTDGSEGGRSQPNPRRSLSQGDFSYWPHGRRCQACRYHRGSRAGQQIRFQ